MRCFCCDKPTDLIDNRTNRSYCTQCWEVITELIVQEENLTEKGEDDIIYVSNWKEEVRFDANTDAPDLSEV